MPKPKNPEKAPVDSPINTENFFYKILKQVPLLVGKHKVSTVDFEQFNNAFDLYCILAAPGAKRSKKTSSLHTKTARDLKENLQNWKKGSSLEEQEEKLYNELKALKDNGLVKAYGWDKQDSELYKLFGQYQNWYYYRRVVEKTTSQFLAEKLNNLDKTKTALSKNEQRIITDLEQTLQPFATTVHCVGNTTPPEIEEPLIVNATPTNSNSSTTAQADQLESAQREAYVAAYNYTMNALDKRKISNPDLLTLLTRFCVNYEMQLNKTEAELIAENTRLRKKKEDLEKKLETTEAENVANKTALANADAKANVSEEAIKVLVVKNNQLQKEINAANMQLVQQLETNKNLQELVAKERENRKILEAQIVQNNATIEKTTLLLNEVQKKNEALQQEKENKNALIAEKKINYLSSGQQEIARLNEALTTAQAALKNAQEQLRKDSLETIKTIETTTKFTAEIKQLKDTIGQLIKDNDLFRNFLGMLKKIFNWGTFSGIQELKNDSQRSTAAAVDQTMLMNELKQRLASLPELSENYSTFLSSSSSGSKEMLLDLQLQLNLSKIDTQKQLINQYAGKISWLVASLLGKALNFPDDWSDIFKAFKSFGPTNMKLLCLSSQLIEDAYKKLSLKLSIKTEIIKFDEAIKKMQDINENFGGGDEFLVKITNLRAEAAAAAVKAVDASLSPHRPVPQTPPKPTPPTSPTQYESTNVRVGVARFFPQGSSKVEAVSPPGQETGATPTLA
jgi:hypothetical protein